MRRHIAFPAAALSFVVLLALVIWQGSFRITYSPSGLIETIVLWAVSTLIFVLTVTLAFMLFRAGVKLYIDRQSNKEGSRIHSKLLFGALALTLAPALFYVLFSVYVLNRTLDKWFSRPAENIQLKLQDLDASYKREAQKRVQAETDWISLLPQVQQAQAGHIDAAFFNNVCEVRGIRQLLLQLRVGVAISLCQSSEKQNGRLLRASADVLNGTAKLGRITAISTLSDDPSPAETAIQQLIEEQNQQAGRRKFYHDTYFLLICLITLFVLFFASWSAQILSRQISVPISALLGAAQEVRRGNLSYRVRVNAIDELATLVRAFNEMTSELEANARELEARRRFTEAILESIPTGVISVSADERIERVNRALAVGIFSPEVVSSAKRLKDLFSPEDLAEIRYLLKRASRTGAAASQLDIQRSSSVLHLAVTVACLEEQRGFVLVLEDTSDLLRAQKSAAWQEVARRIAHEIKNPLTPISLCADRIARQLLRLPMDANVRAILEECTGIIQQEVQTVKSLVDEFSQYSRFPTAQPQPADLNEIVEGAMSVFAGRLDGVAISIDLDRTIPLVLADKEQLKRVIVNLLDNAFEAMNNAPVRKLLLTTSHGSADTVRFSISDTGYGISAADKEKLFLPYFSTKDRGTGLGLAIVSHIVTEHHGKVRVEDNRPTGATFIVELSPLSPADSASSSDAGDPHPATLKV